MTERSAILHGQGIERKMLRMQAKNQIKTFLPARKGLLRKTKNQIQVKVAEACLACPGDSIDGIIIIMDALKQVKFLRMD